MAKDQRKKRSGYDITDWHRDNPDKGLDWILENCDTSFHPPDKPEEKSDIKRTWTAAEIEEERSSKKKADINGRHSAAFSDPERKCVIISGPLHEQIDDAINVLDSKSVFVRGAELVRVLPSGKSVMIKKHSATTIRTHLSRAADWMKDKNGELVRSKPPQDVSSGVLEEGLYPSLSEIKSIATSPIVRPDGSIFCETGLDRVTGVYVDLNIKIELPPDNPTKLEAANAYVELNEPFYDFPFVDPESRAVPIALLLTAIARPMFKNVPAFMMEASTAGSGKTMLSDLLSLIVTGKILAKNTFHVGRDSEEKLENTMNSLVASGTPLIGFDNISSMARFGGPVIEKVLTCGGEVGFRKMKTQEHLTLPYMATMIATGNNILDGVQDETRRRVMPCRLVPDCEDPEKRTGFRHASPYNYVMKNRGKLFTAALTLIKYGINHPEMGATWGSFEEWAKLVPAAINGAIGVDIMKNRDMIQSTSGDDNADFVELLEELHRKYHPMPFTAKKVERDAENNKDLRDLLDRIFGAGGYNSRKIGKLFSSKKDRIQDGYSINAAGFEKKAQKWIINVRKEEQQQSQQELTVVPPKQEYIPQQFHGSHEGEFNNLSDEDWVDYNSDDSIEPF